MTFIAEDVPWYAISPKAVRTTMTDEDYAMSAPRKLGEFATRGEAQAAVASDLKTIAEYGFFVRGGEQGKYLAAAEAILAGVDGVRVHGRYYQVREA